MWLTFCWITSTKLSFTMEEEEVSLSGSSVLNLFNSCRVWILFFSAQVLTAVAPSHGQLCPGPQPCRQFHCAMSPARHLPLKYFFHTTSGSLCWVPVEVFPPALQRADFQQSQRGSTSGTTVTLSGSESQHWQEEIASSLSALSQS